MGDFVKSRLGMKAGAMAASFAFLCGAIYAAEQPTLAQATSRPTHLRSMKRHSTMTPQKALKKIAWAAAPIDQNKWTKPASGSLNLNTAKFRTGCSDGSPGPFKYLTVSSQFGFRAKSCGVGLPPWTPELVPGMFKRPLAKLGRSFMRSVGLDYQQATKKVAGNRSKVTATFKCSPAASPSERGVKTIVVRKNGRATMSRCPVASSARAELIATSARSTSRHSTMTPQKALKKISWAAAPISQNQWTKPTSGTLTGNSAKFKSDCAFQGGGPWRHLTVNPSGVGYAACGVGVPDYDPDTHLGQFKKPLVKLGKSFMRSVGLDFEQTTKKIAGNRSKVTATFRCPPAASPSDRGVKTIVVRKNGRATITRCHVG